MYGNLVEGIVPRDTGDMSQVGGTRFERLKAPCFFNKRTLNVKRAELPEKISGLSRKHGFDECHFSCSGVFFNLCCQSLLSCSPASDFFRSFNALMAVRKALVQSSGAPLKACLDRLLHFGRQIDRL